MRGLLIITHLTLHEAARRRVLLAALIGGVAFLILFAVGFFFIHREMAHHGGVALLQQRMMLTFAVMAGLYAVNFLTIMTAVLMPVDTLSGEIASGVIQTLASKPIPRASIVLGKWLAFAVIVAGYLALMAGGVLLVARLLGQFTPTHVERGLPLMLLEGLVLMTLSIAGGTRFSTITNGMLVFGLFGLAFIGSWMEQIGTFAGNLAARNVGTAASLLMPSESLWQLAAWHMQPPLMRDLHLTPFSPASVPSPAMVVWAVAYLIVTLVLAVRAFDRRGL
jgi:Cu-processing system permease protein